MNGYGPSHWYACSGGGWIFWDFGVDLSLSDDVVPWLRLKPPVECNPHPYHMYTKCLSTLICYEWVYGSTLTVYACAGRGWIFRDFGIDLRPEPESD